ncbi:uncharacterized protein BT62DRAFT_1006519 [Guyanagaster necrorhizus]|uniref:Uncharacterized protein n=1 Tax=Guyanagaster necrorhizus TaxID=856835 RepID=A0A9P7VRT7_9AGAR|nr:uncharacterized protein BT62DRAFT_1006519 [Guyanagaster necrorhizus MCA 3950]KAG7445540.1 hypothetical protein BT62DRAFT_1006519 [Guyanagaster necrorhizus MCA 3950]
MFSGLFQVTRCSSPPPRPAPAGGVRCVFNVRTFIEGWLRDNPDKTWLDMGSVAPSLPTKQRVMFTYRCQDRGDWFEILSMFDDHKYRRGWLDPYTGRQLLENETWIDKDKKILPRRVWCLGCKKCVVFVEGDYDVREWQDHRDFCEGITGMMKIEIVRSLIRQNQNPEVLWPPNSLDPIVLVGFRM